MIYRNIMTYLWIIYEYTYYLYLMYLWLLLLKTYIYIYIHLFWQFSFIYQLCFREVDDKCVAASSAKARGLWWAQKVQREHHFRFFQTQLSCTGRGGWCQAARWFAPFPAFNLEKIHSPNDWNDCWWTSQSFDTLTHHPITIWITLCRYGRPTMCRSFAYLCHFFWTVSLDSDCHSLLDMETQLIMRSLMDLSAQPWQNSMVDVVWYWYIQISTRYQEVPKITIGHAIIQLSWSWWSRHGSYHCWTAWWCFNLAAIATLAPTMP